MTTSGNLIFTEITSVADSRFSRAFDIYVEAFPATERQTRTTIEQRLAAGKSRLFTAVINNEVVLMSLLFNLSSDKFILLDYMAVSKAHRGQKIGESFLQFIATHLKNSGKYLVIEVEDPRFGDNKDQRIRRVNFYRNCGAKLLKGVHYILPSLNGTIPTEMLLMLLPASAEIAIKREVVKDLILKLYTEVYNRDENDSLLNSIIDTLPPGIELTNQLTGLIYKNMDPQPDYPDCNVKLKKLIDDCLDEKNWPVPNWLKGNAKTKRNTYKKYDKLFLSELRAKYVEIESDFRASLSDFKPGETDWAVAEMIRNLLNETRQLLEADDSDKLCAANAINLLDRYLIWIFPPALVKMRSEILSENILSDYPFYSKKLAEAINCFAEKCNDKGPNEQDMKNIRAVYDEVKGKINRDKIDKHTNKELQLNKLAYLNKIGIAVLLVAILVFGFLTDPAKLYESYSSRSYLNIKIFLLDTKWIILWCYVFVGAMGAFISGMMEVRNSTVNLADYQETEGKLYLRLLIGGIMSLIVIVSLSKGILDIEIKNNGTFLLLAFLSGFSERYFLRIFKLTAEGDVQESKEIKK